MRPSDTVARLGGDEFALLLDELESQDQANLVAKRIEEEIRQSLRIESQSVLTTASIGITFSSNRYEQSEDMMRHADEAMYRAKQLGKNQHVVFEDCQPPESAEIGYEHFHPQAVSLLGDAQARISVRF